MNKTTCDISDKLHPDVQYLKPIYKSYGAKTSFSGRIVTVKCYEDNSLVETALRINGKDSVLVIDAGGSMNCAMLGDKRVTDAINNEWEGILVHGLIRDSATINSMEIGVRALGVCPLKSVKKGVGDSNITVNFSGVTFNPGEYLYADEDGVIVIKEKTYL
ncbi:MAG: ribonuclease E activity regulator RraA [Candidatus Marinimicrobia bacterium]|nr:ribonuclease E activity regulator RraA [Candidatus Neomarinimicrobiota bacterium]